MTRQSALNLAAIVLACTCTSTAQTVYKSVDSAGRVSYSSTPPPEAAGETLEVIPISPGPTENQRQEADGRAKELQGATRRAEQQRKEQSTKTKQAISKAEQELRDAEAGLQEAKIQGDDDWQYLAGGGRVLKRGYLNRVEAAERKVEEAKKALRGARSAKP